MRMRIRRCGTSCFYIMSKLHREVAVTGDSSDKDETLQSADYDPRALGCTISAQRFPQQVKLLKIKSSLRHN